MPPNGLVPLRHGRRINLPSKHSKIAMLYLLKKNILKPKNPEDNSELLLWSDNAAILVR